jgi:hypothetical protein
MATPSEKNPAIESLLTELNGGRSRRAYIYANRCVKCEGDARLFVDQVSRREYEISGWCQHCQDELFNDTTTEGM